MGLTTYSGSSAATFTRKQKTWTLCSSAKTNATNTYNLPIRPTSRVKYNNGYYYFAGHAGWIFYSTDAKNWNATNSGVNSNTSSGNVFDVAYNGSVWVSIYSNQNYAYSTNLTTWSTPTTAPVMAGNVNLVEWVPAWNLFVMASDNSTIDANIISTSPDGNTWTSRFSGGTTGSTNNTFAYNPTTGTGFINRTNVNGIWSTNGTTWNSVAHGNSKAFYIGGAINRFVAGQYSQTPASIGSAWNTTVYTYVIQSQANNWLSSTSYNSPRFGNTMYPIFDSSNNLLYVLNGVTTSSGPGVIKTYDCSQAITTYFDAAGATILDIPEILTEPTPDYFNSGLGEITFGYGNGIFIYVTSGVNSNSWPRIYTTAS